MGEKIKATLYISKEKRETIRQSGLSLEEYCDRLFEMHEQFSMDKWKDGYFCIDFFRVCLLRAETLNLILNRFNDNDLYQLGRDVGAQLRSTIKNSFNHYLPLDDEAKIKLVEYFNRYSGWGTLTLENGVIFITLPIFIRPHFVQGYIEGLMNIHLTIIEAHRDRMSFKISQ